MKKKKGSCKLRIWRNGTSCSFLCFVIAVSASCVQFSSRPPSSSARCNRDNLKTLTVDSDEFKIDKLYRSMEGPSSTKKIKLSDNEQPELCWIRSIRADIIDVATGEPVSPEYMCHANLDIGDIKLYKKNFDNDFRVSTRIATLSQGQLSFQFPEGFGMPILSSDAIRFVSQVLNLNHPNKKFDIKQRLTIDYILDRDLKTPITPLFGKSVYAMAAIDGKEGHYGARTMPDSADTSGCLSGEPASEIINVFKHSFNDQFKRQFTGHWVVPPGRQVNHSLVTHLLALPFDTSVHYIVVHLHPFAESLELRDLTTGETLFKSMAKSRKSGIGLSYVEPYSSETGFLLYKDHDYEVISIYNNTTDDDMDAMAVMYMFLANKHYKPPVL